MKSKSCDFFFDWFEIIYGYFKIDKLNWIEEDVKNDEGVVLVFWTLILVITFYWSF